MAEFNGGITAQRAQEKKREGECEKRIMGEWERLRPKDSPPWSGQGWDIKGISHQPLNKLYVVNVQKCFLKFCLTLTFT